jgi:cytochrome c oxidase subunit 2
VDLDLLHAHLEERVMKLLDEVDSLERKWMLLTVVVLLAFAGLLVWSVVAHGAGLPSPAGRIDPAEVRSTPPFDQPGLYVDGNPDDDVDYELVYTAQAWAWVPAEVDVPVGSRVRIRATTVDVIHGLWIPETDANVMVIPGQISEHVLTFDEEETLSLICHEYCGIQHHVMGALINVVPTDDVETIGTSVPRDR